MNDSLAQHSAQTPSPSTGSRQDTHKVGSAISSASLAACVHAPPSKPSARRQGATGVGVLSASITSRLARHRLDCQRRHLGVPTGRASNPVTAPVLFDRALLARRLVRSRKLGPAAFLLDRVREDLVERLAAVNRSFTEAADIWTPGEGLSLPQLNVRHVDIISSDETLPLTPASLDLVVSALAFQFVNDLPG